MVGLSVSNIEIFCVLDLYELMPVCGLDLGCVLTYSSKVSGRKPPSASCRPVQPLPVMVGHEVSCIRSTGQRGTISDQWSAWLRRRTGERETVRPNQSLGGNCVYTVVASRIMVHTVRCTLNLRSAVAVMGATTYLSSSYLFTCNLEEMEWASEDSILVVFVP